MRELRPHAILVNEVEPLRRDPRKQGQRADSSRRWSHRSRVARSLERLVCCN
jgi:hypothetical protein